MRTKHNQSEPNQQHHQGYDQEDTLVRMPALRANVPPRASGHPSAIASIRPRYPHGLSDLERVTHLDITRLPTVPQRPETTQSRRGNVPSLPTEPRGGSDSSLPTNPTSTERRRGNGPSLPTEPRGDTDDRKGSSLRSLPPTPTLSATSHRKTNDPITEDNVCDIQDIIAMAEIDPFLPDLQARLHPQLKNTPHVPSPFSDMDTLPISSVQGQPQTVPQLPTSIGQITRPQRGSTWHSIDKIRWWLLTPGRLEFVLCLIGVIFLLCVTSFFLLAITLSLGLFGSRG